MTQSLLTTGAPGVATTQTGALVTRPLAHLRPAPTHR